VRTREDEGGYVSRFRREEESIFVYMTTCEAERLTR
jgi:hypothetical protein